MPLDFDDLIALWVRPLPEGSAAIAAFAQVYTDPVKINGTLMPLAGVVERARATQRAFSDLGATLLARADAPDHTTIVFRMRGRHTGPLATPLGGVAATGKMCERQIIDLLVLREGRVAEVWMVGDELAALMQLGVIARAA